MGAAPTRYIVLFSSEAIKMVSGMPAAPDLWNMQGAAAGDQQIEFCGGDYPDAVALAEDRQASAFPLTDGLAWYAGGIGQFANGAIISLMPGKRPDIDPGQNRCRLGVDSPGRLNILPGERDRQLQEKLFQSKPGNVTYRWHTVAVSSVQMDRLNSYSIRATRPPESSPLNYHSTYCQQTSLSD